MADKSPLVSRVPFDVTRPIFDYYGVMDDEAQRSLIKKVMSRFPDEGEIDRDDFRLLLEQEIFDWHQRTVTPADDEPTNMAEVDLVQPSGEVLSTEEYDTLADVTDKDLQAAIRDWKTVAPDKFSNLLEANEQ